jgi:beta-galactosidase
MNYKSKLILLCLYFAVTCATAITYSREVKSINAKWNFSKGMSSPRGFGRGGSQQAQIVNLPHTWNSIDFMADGGYYRGYGSYTRDLDIPADYKGKRIFIKFDGAGSVANVFLNSNFIGEHKGAYNSFTYEITDFVNFGGKNSISVICDNSARLDVAPQGGDFNIYGGLYRDVWLIVTDDDACISPLYYSSTGVFVNQLLVTEKRAELRAEIFLSTRSDYKN